MNEELAKVRELLQQSMWATPEAVLLLLRVVEEQQNQIDELMSDKKYRDEQDMGDDL